MKFKIGMSRDLIINEIDVGNRLHTEKVTDQVWKSHQDDGYTITIARSFLETEEIRGVWKEMQPQHFADIDYFFTVFHLRKEIIRPHVILLRRNGRPETMLIGRIEKVRFKCKIGYEDLFNPNVHSLTIVEGGVLGNTSYANCSVLISELLKSLKRGEADIVSFKEIPTDSHLYQLAKEVPNLFCRDHFPAVDTHFRMTLPASMDDFYKARKRKKDLPRIVRRLGREFSGNILVKRFCKREDVKQFCKDAEAISRKTYQYALGGGFVNNTETQKLISILADRGRFISYILYIENKPCAFEGGHVYNNIFFSIYCGYDPQYKQFQIGTILMLKIIEDLCYDNHFQYFDNGPGDLWYKRRFCEINWKEASFYIFAPSFKGFRLNILRILTGTAFQIGDRILTQLKWREKWNKYKRNRFTPEAKEHGVT